MSDKVNIRLADEKDRIDILNLQNSVFSKQQRSSLMRDDKMWNWKYVQNPFGKAQLTVAVYNNEIIGVDNFWPWELRVNDDLIKTMQPCDSAVSPIFRGKGIFKRMRLYGIEQAKEKNVKLIFNFPNTNSLPGNLSLGSVYLGRVQWLVKIIKPFRILRGKFSKRKAEPFQIGDEYQVNSGLLDDIANHTLKPKEFIEINRISGFHQWRYSDRPHRTYGMVHYCGDAGTTAAVFTINQKGMNREMVVVDLLGSTGNTIAVFNLLKEAAKVMDVDFIALMNNPVYKTHLLWRLGFLKKKLKNMVVLPIDSSLVDTASSFTYWSMVAAIHDSI